MKDDAIYIDNKMAKFVKSENGGYYLEICEPTVKEIRIENNRNIKQFVQGKKLKRWQ